MKFKIDLVLKRNQKQTAKIRKEETNRKQRERECSPGQPTWPVHLAAQPTRGTAVFNLCLLAEACGRARDCRGHLPVCFVLSPALLATPRRRGRSPEPTPFSSGHSPPSPRSISSSAERAHRRRPLPPLPQLSPRLSVLSPLSASTLRSFPLNKSKPHALHRRLHHHPRPLHPTTATVDSPSPLPPRSS